MKIKILKYVIYLSSFTLMVMVKPIQAEKYHPLQDIADTATNYVISHIPKEYQIESLKTAKVDSRIKFKKCQEPLVAFTSGTFKVNRNLTIGVKCKQPSWKFYVAIKAAITTDVVVANTTILRGELISKDKLSVIRKKINNQNNQYFRSTRDIIGKLAKRNIRVDRMITASLLQTRYLVKRKQQVMIVAKNSNLMVKMNGIALKNGKNNDRIKVRNVNSNKIIEGVVSAEGVVTVNF